MSWQPPNYPKGWGKPPPHTPSPIPFRQMYTPSPPHITSSKHYPVGSPCMSPTSSSASSSRLPPPYIPCPKPTRPLAISPLAMPVYLPDQHGGPSQHNPTQNYLYQDNHMPANVYLEPLSSILHENSYNDQSDGRSTAEIIANQSQDYVDEKLAEYQATIFQLQGTTVVYMYYI